MVPGRISVNIESERYPLSGLRQHYMRFLIIQGAQVIKAGKGSKKPK